MKKITDLFEGYQQGKFDKSEFISQMYKMHHGGLFEYADHLVKTNIRKIEVVDGQVIMTTRDRGVRFLCVPGDHRIAPIEILNFFDYEKSEATMIERLIDDCDVFFDIGANMGWYSINVALSNRNVQIYCFEPIGRTFTYLRKNLELNSITNVNTHNFGFSNKTGTFDFYYYDEGSGNASSVNVSARCDVQVYQCQVTTLDQFATEQHLTVDFIKCDVEGAELLVFEGGQDTIARNLPIVYSEILRKWSAKFGYNPNEILSFFERLGYRAFTVNGNKLQEFFSIDEATVQTNFFFLHAKKHTEQIMRLGG